MKPCVDCGGSVKGNYERCFRCQLKNAREEGYALGFQTGQLQGERNAKQSITPDRLRQLKQLCHPDKHGGNELSNDVATWLNSIKAE